MSLARRVLGWSPVVVLACCLGVTPSVADDDDIFLVDAVPPNVVILLDSSGSMMDHIGGQTKISIARDVVTSLIENVPSVRFGVFRFNDDSTGAELVEEVGTDMATLVASVNAINATGETPLGRALADVQDYYLGVFTGSTSSGLYYESGHGRHGFTSDCDGESVWDDEDEDEDEDADDSCGNPDAAPGDLLSPIEYVCQGNYVIVVTDGMPNGEAETLVADVAASLYATDHSPLEGVQNVITYTVGFDVPAGTDLLTQTATNGHGTFYTASTATQLEVALQEALTQILASSYSFSAPMFPSTSAADLTKAYLASFEPDPVAPFWEGHLKAYTREADGTIAVDADNVPLDSSVVWDAGTQLAAKAASTRTIYTAVSGARQSFTTSNATITQGMLGVSSSTLRTRVISFIRGLDAYDWDGDGVAGEERPWKLGDIFHSAPVLVFPPPLESSDSSYQAFKAANAGRTSIVLVGANDGMLHAFRASDGEELWGFIPTDLLDDLRFLTPRVGAHRHYVDGTPVVTDVKISGTWKTVAIFGTRRGGRTYYALDITDTTNPLYLWSFTSSRMGETWSVPALGQVRLAGGVEKTVAFVGGGYDTANNNATGKSFFVIDVSNGSLLWEYYNSGGTTDRSKMNFSIPASPRAVDLDADGFVDQVFVGDVGGQLWKFDVSAVGTLVSGVVTNWTGRRLFAADSTQANPPAAGAYYPDQAIYGSPALAYDVLDQLWIFFGTGDRNHPNAVSNNHFFGIKDDGSMTNDTALTESSLTDMSSGSGTVTAGWYMALRDEEKVLDSAEVFAQIVYFSTYTPSTTATCQQEHGTARLYAVAMDGTSPEEWEDPDEDDTRSTTIGTGIPSAPQIVSGPDGPLLVVGTTSQELEMDDLELENEFDVRYWREVY
jgi:type IV pilus assembly protein PilY1